MGFAIMAWYRYHNGTYGAPVNGLLRDPDTDRVLAYASRDEAHAWIDDTNAVVHYLRHGEAARPLYTVRDAGTTSGVVMRRHAMFHVRQAAAAVQTWDHEDVRVLREALKALSKACDEAWQERVNAEPEHFINMDDLPSEDIPEGLDRDNVWAIDRRGMVLTGPGADQIVPLDDLLPRGDGQDGDQASPRSAAVIQAPAEAIQPDLSLYVAQISPDTLRAALQGYTSMMQTAFSKGVLRSHRL